MRASGGLVCQGIIDGTNGTDGYNTVVVPLYRRSASVLTDNNRPSGPLTYTFSTGRLTGASTYFNGWSQTIPTASANTKLYVIMAVARSQSDTDEIAATDWSTPVEYVADGMSSAPVFIYKRADSQPTDKPADGAVYTFATGALTGTLNGWSTNIPATDNNHYPCWVRQAMAVSRGTTDTINADEWSNPATKLVEDGVSISSADIVFVLSDSGSTAPADSVSWKTTFAELDITSTNASKYIWQATKVTLSNNTTKYTGKQCLGKVSEFASVTEQYALGTASAATGSWQDNTPPTAEKGKYLWTRTKLVYSGGGTTYVPSESGQCIGYFGNDGAAGYSIALTLIRNNLYTDANWNTYAELGHSENYSKRTGDSDFTACRVSDYFVVTGTSSDSGKNHTAIYKCTSVNANSITGTCVSHTKDGEKGDDAQYIYLKGSAFNKDSAGTNVAASEIKVNGGSNLATQSRGLCLVTLNRQTLAVVDSATIYDTYEGTTGKNNLITKLNSLGTNVFVCLVSYDAIGWSDTLISTLQSFGMSDLPYTSANRYPFLFIGYKNLGKGNGITRMNDMAEPAIPVELGVYVANGALSVKDGKDGEDGDDAVTYQIVFTEAWAKVDASNVITARLRGNAYKIVGSTRTILSNATIRIGYILTNSNTYVDITTNSDGYFTESDWFNGDTYGASGYSQGSQSIFAAIIVGTGIMCVEYVTMTFAGAKGDTGRMYYIAGEFPKKAPYSRTDKLCPVVYYGGEWWYLDVASATGSDTPSDSSTKWKKLQNYGVVLTDAIFVKNFAQFGAAIITGDWLISVHGMIGNTYYGGSVENPDEYNNRAAYTYFDPAYPWGYDPFQLPVIEEDVETDQYHEWTRLTNNFKLPAGTYTFNISCYVNSSDSMHLRLFNGDESSDALYLGGTSSDELVTLTYTKTLTSSQYWNLCATMNAAGEFGFVTAVEVVPSDPRFIPNYAVDLRTGKTYQSDAHIKGAIQCIGPTSKITIEDGVIRMFGAMSFPNIVLGVNEDGCAVLNFYDKNGKFKYGLGPDKIIETLSQAESMKLTYYDVDAGSNDCTALADSDYVTIYLYTYKNQSPAYAKCLYKYLAKISANVYGGNYVNNDDTQGRKFNGKIIKQNYSIPLQNSNIYNGGIVMSSDRVQCGMVSYLSNMLSGTSYEELDYRGYDIMKDSDFNVNKDGYVYRFVTKDPYNPTEAFYIDRSYYNDGVGYSGVYADKYHLNLCTDPEYDDKLIDPIYWFNLICINSEGASLGVKTLYINRSKLKRLLQDAGYSL